MYTLQYQLSKYIAEERQKLASNQRLADYERRKHQSLSKTKKHSQHYIAPMGRFGI